MDFETYSLTSKEVVKDTVQVAKKNEEVDIKENKGFIPQDITEEEAYKNRVIKAIGETSDGGLMETLLEFAEMMDYKEAFCSPILELDSAFFTSMDEIDHYTMALQKKQIELLKQIVSLLSGEVIMIPPNSITDKGRAHWTSEEMKEMQRKGK